MPDTVGVHTPPHVSGKRTHWKPANFSKNLRVDWFVFLECDFAQCFFNTEMDEHRAEEVIFRRHSRRTACIMK
jgi:hypothetical protein